MSKLESRDATSPSEGAMLLPWHVTDRLSAEEDRLVAEALAGDPALNQELEIERRLHASINDPSVQPKPMPGAFERLMRRIETADGASVQDRRSWLPWLSAAWLRPLLAAAAVVALVEAGVIGYLASDLAREETFRTASGPPGSGPQAPDVVEFVRLAVGFTAAATIVDLDEWLVEHDGAIVRGPLPGAVFLVEVPQGKADRGLASAARRPGVVREVHKAF
jgi:hypothetical protein